MWTKAGGDLDDCGGELPSSLWLQIAHVLGHKLEEASLGGRGSWWIC